MANPFDAGFLKKIQEVQANLARAQEELKDIRVEGTAAGGLVTAVVNGHKELIDIKIAPDAIADDDLEMLEDLIVAAVSSASQAAEAKASETMAGVTGGMLPPGMDLGSLFGG